MTDYQRIKTICEESSRNLKSFFDDFLMYYSDEREGFSKIFVDKIKPFRSIITKMPQEWIPTLCSQYIAHKIFKQGGLAGKYMNNAKVQKRPAREIEYFKYQAEHPWRFSFAAIERCVAENFFEMRDVITEQPFLLYSKGQTDIADDIPVTFFFHLIGFNGHCWHTSRDFSPLTCSISQSSSILTRYSPMTCQPLLKKTRCRT
ncbi:MAG: hypothetical protein ABIA63_03010 [bacterium]